MLFIKGLDTDFLENTPEARAMREIREEASLKIVKDLASLVDEEPEHKYIFGLDFLYHLPSIFTQSICFS